MGVGTNRVLDETLGVVGLLAETADSVFHGCEYTAYTRTVKR